MEHSWPRRTFTPELQLAAPKADEILFEMLRLLANRVGLRLWLVSRPGFAPTALEVPPGAAPIPEVAQDLLAWAEQIPSAVGGPEVKAVAIPDVRDHPAFDRIAQVGELEVGALIAAPIPVSDSDHGWICGVHPYPVSNYLVDDLQLVTVQADLLSLLWSLEQVSDRARLEAVEAKDSRG